MAKKAPNIDPYVFISSSSKDRELTERLVDFLRENGIPSLSDINSNFPGTNWEKQNEEALRNSTVVISLATRNYLDSEWFHSSANLAIGLEINLIPVAEDDLDSSQLPNWFKQRQYVRFPSHKEQLLQAILTIFGEDQNLPNVPTSLAGKKESTKAPVKGINRKQATSQVITESASPSHPSSANTSPGEDRTPFHKDTPSQIDYLGRKGFVEALAEWIDRYWTEYQTADKSFIINIHGQWGAGKTTFLNLLQRELQSKSSNNWIVVWFSAWENRHIKPEWWPLMDKIYRDSVEQKKGKREWVWFTKFREWLWRFYSGRKLDLLGFVVSLVLLSVVIYWVFQSGAPSNDPALARMEATAKSISAIFTLLSTAFLGTRFISRTVTFGSAKAAEIYLQFTPDPIENIKRHFDDLVENKINKPVIVFIDDLDRCDRGYLVNLLEGVQTLLNHKKVFYVIAADQRWLFAAFEENYKEFKDSIKEPGKKIGYLFLEKIFQLSLSIPNVSNEARAVYLDYLLGNEKKDQLEEKREEIKKAMANITSEQALIDRVQSEPSGTIEKVIMREVAVAKSASLEIEHTTVHFLSNFAHLMDPNPRSIKRLVTFYGVLRAIAILSDEEMISDLTKRNQLALWTIVKMRWPLLGDYLEEYPEHLTNFKSGKSNKAIHTDVLGLVKDIAVRDVLNGKGLNCELDVPALKRFISLKATERTF